MIDSYDWAGGREAMMRFGPDAGPVVVAALPLFEEANRTRSFVVTILRLLAARGIAGALPDLPGQGESLVPTHRTSLLKLQDAFNFACDRFDREGRPCYALALRSGALLDVLAPVAGRWHFAPIPGEKLLRELKRTALAADPQRKDLDSLIFGGEAPIEIAGNLVSPALLGELAIARPAPNARIVRLATDTADAALKVEGSPLWRRAEPDNDPALATLLADDIAAWIRACAS
ncbi:hypothetical protein J2W22_002557 [Sphingomonas kyeonggiensis]|uniref:hypothetical protein n=1 Tax=Sphingomonas kyeonggiensis TaxID=1268553 RepID=UPI0027841738|nr:hypothetical protein [Sphingomonas kyeonggiensis]MDQ0250493.1 hypothetical protein [Sphingomonas kyeonggiensis]